MNATDFLEKVKNDHKKYSDESAFLTEKVSGFGDICKKISKNNDIRANLITASLILVFVSMFLLILTSIIFILFKI